MTDIAIQVESLSKQYRIGEHEEYKTLRDTLTSALYSPYRHVTNLIHRTPPAQLDHVKTIWALKDVSFEIKQGEVVGIIGRNGAGKSTLLKILSRITEPTEGQARIFGRVGSLLEIGTGFHPELTGRENIYLNGAILGMRRSEIERKFDEMVAFAEIDEFIDTPVKHYSSGMYLRLAFAVAAHLEPEILLVDEVLAVGDVAFQNKSLGKIHDVAKEGRTVLFVSHNMGAIAQLCPKSMLLRSGRIETVEQSETVIARYLSENASQAADVHLDPRANPNSAAVVTRLWIADQEGSPIDSVDVTKPFNIGLAILVRQVVTGVDVSIRLRNALGQPLLTTNLSDSDTDFRTFEPGQYSFLISVPGNFMAPDTYSVMAAIHRPLIKMYDLQDWGFTFRVVESGSKMWRYHGQAYGNILVQFPWNEIVD